MAHYQSDDPAKAAAHAESVAPCSVSVWRTPEGVHFVVDKVGSYSSDEADLLDGRFVDGGEKARAIRAWMEETADTY